MHVVQTVPHFLKQDDIGNSWQFPFWLDRRGKNDLITSCPYIFRNKVDLQNKPKSSTGTRVDRSQSCKLEKTDPKLVSNIFHVFFLHLSFKIRMHLAFFAKCYYFFMSVRQVKKWVIWKTAERLIHFTDNLNRSKKFTFLLRYLRLWSLYSSFFFLKKSFCKRECCSITCYFVPLPFLCSKKQSEDEILFRWRVF